MRESDFEAFCELWVAAHETYGKVPTPAALRIAFAALEPYSLEQVSHALTAHLRNPERGQYPPKPADVIAAISAEDGHLPAEEAWAIAVMAEDEDETLVWTDEIAQAWGVARPILAVGDRIGARQAFVSAYQRLVAEARAAGRAPRWTISPGRNVERRRAVVEQAVAEGRISAERAKTLLPPADGDEGFGNAVAGMLAGKVSPLPQDPKARARLAELRKVIDQAEQRLEAEAAARRERARKRRERIERERARQLGALYERMEQLEQDRDTSGDCASAGEAAEADR
ncbi:MAG TPA: hypothetical protein ENK57_24670 [Polyangiaceae bacterium]|nr:hypothetical protein [Polyangiaceae bacterium]